MTEADPRQRPGTGQEEAARLLRGELAVVGLLREASNVTLRVRLSDGTDAVYKPVRGERPLRDFPPGTLAAREVAAAQVSDAGGWGLVPPTVLREGPMGAGMVQRWIPHAAEQQDRWLTACRPADLPAGWLPVVRGEDERGRDVVVAHPDDPQLLSVAVLDTVLNNADRKGAHLLADPDGRLWGVDHGLVLHTEPKLRTVLWGFAGRPLPAPERDRLTRVREALAGGLAAALGSLLSGPEVTALRDRVEELLEVGRLPQPPPDRYPLPWPLW
ncbi:SCO1664 family protein [Ornithinicoccus halotolerans]|uniref:SCO1664 family protein n=1 Tax=Ornithinicoccus halotolerans TaxID=1748220 RepID=UPI001294EC94|nr:SCO1664 family protein [Ornithinicoccus halotolerans]